MRSYLASIFVASALALSLCGCGTPEPASPGGFGITRTPAEQPASDSEQLVAGNTEFALDLYQRIRGDEGNLFFSPYSVSMALAMVYAGARGETERQMADTLHFTLPQDRLHPAFKELRLELARRAEPAPASPPEPPSAGRSRSPRGRAPGPGRAGASPQRFELHIANALWVPPYMQLTSGFTDVISQCYDADMQEADFSGDPEGATRSINDWVERETHGRITDIIPPGRLTSIEVLVLANAVYFRAPWVSQFTARNTRDGPFHLLDGTTVTAKMMTQVASFGYAEGDGYQAVELPYEGGETSMVVLLPDRDRFREFEEMLDPQALSGVLASIRPARLRLTMPKFNFVSSYLLDKHLSAMGMPNAFRGANFSGMAPSADLFISFVIHKAYVDVNEEGTEAAAATAVGIGRGGGPSGIVEVAVDHPFIFLIRDRETGAILFLGRVLDPTAG